MENSVLSLNPAEPVLKRNNSSPKVLCPVEGEEQSVRSKFAKNSSSSQETCFTDSEYVAEFLPDAKVAKQKISAELCPKNTLRRMRRPLRRLNVIDDKNRV